MIGQFFRARTFKAMTESANKIAEDVRQNAKTERMRQAITVKTVEDDGNGRFSVALEIDLKKAPEFMAYEKGSGIHGEKGTTYPIKPKNGPQALAFMWPGHTVGQKASGKYWGYFGDKENPTFLFRYVDHPGVKAEPALQPAIQRQKRSIRELLRRAVGQGIVKDIFVEIKENA